MKPSYKVLIVINDKWMSDNRAFPNFNAARQYQNQVARDNWKYDTAIGKGSEVLNFRDSLYEAAHFENDCRD